MPSCATRTTCSDITGVLERSLRWDDAIVWLMADHGEYLGEKGMWYHDPWFPPQDAVLRIPLAVVQRGQVPATRIEEPAQLLDVGDTTLGLLSKREGVRPWSLGRDLGPLIEGESWPTRRPIVSENQASKSGDRTEAFQLDPYTFRRTPRGEWVTGAKRGVPTPGPAAFGGVLEAYRGLSQTFEAHASGQEPEVISPSEIDQLRALGYIE
jgi:arylsulfatase A-like enzyme